MISSLHSLSIIQKCFISGIIFLIIIIVSYAIFILNHQHHPTSQIDIQLASLAATYYEDYFFPTLESSIRTQGTSSLSDTLSHYTDTGFAKVPLHQILLHTTHSSDNITALTEYCDENTTFVHFFPEPPFTTTSYYFTYDYSCNF